MEANMAEAIWKSGNTTTPVSQLNTFHLKNAISKVERELNEATVADRTGKETILAALKTEAATRTDA